MILCVSGDTHGALDRLYADVSEFERSLQVRFAALLHVGDFGIWPDPQRVDRATRDHEGAGDFPRWIGDGRGAPRPTSFIKGNHEDFDWIDTRKTTELISGLNYVPNGRSVDLPEGKGAIRVAGVGGCFGPSDYERRKLQGYSKRHYTRGEIEALAGRRPIDILLLHDAPLGVTIVQKRAHGQERRYVSNAEGLDRAVASARPQICFFGHHHARVTAEVAGVPCLGLNIVGRPGYLVAVDVPSSSREPWMLLGEWPAADVPYRPVWPEVTGEPMG
jgi:predicted phosphodiesterase